jgi:hypothetical protein
MSGHPPFPAQVILNDHEYVACQASAAGIAFGPEFGGSASYSIAHDAVSWDDARIFQLSGEHVGGKEMLVEGGEIS